MQWKLGALAHRADEEADAGDGQQWPLNDAQIEHLGGFGRRHFEDGRVIETAEVGEYQADSERETEVADAVNQEGLEVGVDRGGPGEPETDQEV